MDRLSVVILNWNGIVDTLACVKSLQNQSIKDLKIVIVDNGSMDNSVKILKKYVSINNNIELILNKNNLGFAGGVNTGIKWSIKNNFKYVALLNNDAIADKYWLEKLYESIKLNGVGISTGALLDSTGDYIDSTGDWYSIWGLAFPRGRNKLATNLPAAGFVFGATGGASLYKVAMLEEIGLFDEDFFAYYEDVDVSFRAQLRGWKVHFNPNAKAYHKRGESSKKIPGFNIYQTFKNLPLLFIKNVTLSLILPIGIRFITAYNLMFLNAIRRGQGLYALRGWLKSLYLMLKKLPERHRIQKSRKASNEYLSSIIYNDLPPDQSGLIKLRTFFIKK